MAPRHTIFGGTYNTQSEKLALIEGAWCHQVCAHLRSQSWACQRPADPNTLNKEEGSVADDI